MCIRTRDCQLDQMDGSTDGAGPASQTERTQRRDCLSGERRIVKELRAKIGELVIPSRDFLSKAFGR